MTPIERAREHHALHQTDIERLPGVCYSEVEGAEDGLPRIVVYVEYDKTCYQGVTVTSGGYPIRFANYDSETTPEARLLAAIFAS